MAITTPRPEPRAAVPQTKHRQPRVLVVVVTHRGRQWIRRCLVGLNSQTYPHLDVLVVDDASPDVRQPPHLKRIVKRHLTKRRWGFVRTPRPLGYGGAINWALARIRSKAEFLLFVHDDAELDPTAVEAMVDRMMSDEKIGIVGPKVVSWDDPTHLEEVGMRVDRFGYPYKGLEDDEIDLGQHDKAREVFFVTSTCLLIRAEVFRGLRGWDVRMRAFSEDLDLCWRARIAGHLVAVEPKARARHAIAMAKGERVSAFASPRYFGRRNRLRAIAKNVSGPRIVWLIPQFVLITMIEMLGFIVLRQPREIAHLGRALGWNVLHLLQTLRERSRVQRTRRVTDRWLNRHTVRQFTRIRAYVTHQAGRLEEAWGRRAEVFSRQSSRARTASMRALGWPAAATAILLLALILGLRNFLWAQPAAIGSLLPYPDSATAMWRSFASPWHAAGLGQPGPGPPAFLLLGLFPILTAGVAGAAQKLLVLALGVTAFVGGYRLLSDLVGRPGRITAGLVYALGSVGYVGLRGGALGALVFGAVAPFGLRSLLRLGGFARPAFWRPTRELALLSLSAGVSAAFVPGALGLIALVGGVVALARALMGHGRESLGTLGATLAGVAIGFGLVLPWSLTWLEPGGVLESLLNGGDRSVFAVSFSDHGLISTLLGQTPDGLPLFGLALPLGGSIALIATEGQRRRVALVLWAVVVATGWFVWAVASGAIPPIVASPIEGGVFASLAFAGLAGLAVGGFRLDLPRRNSGWLRAITLGLLATAGFLMVAGVGPSLLRGEWVPGGEGGSRHANAVQTVRTFLTGKAAEVGQFRALWVGESWTSGAPTATQSSRPYHVSGPQGEVLRDLFPRDHGRGEEELATVVSSIHNGSTDRGGRLLGAFNIYYVVVQPGPSADGWLSQRDLALVRQEPDYLLLENAVRLPRAAVWAELPVYVRALETRDPSSIREPIEDDVERLALQQRSPALYSVADAGGPGVVFLAEAKDPNWEATIGGRPLRRAPGGWGNAFVLPAEARGDLVVAAPWTTGQAAWYAGLILAWIVVVGAAFSRRDRRPVPVLESRV